MPLRCVDFAGQNIHAFDLSEEAWNELAVLNKSQRHLRTSCCGAEVMLKRSKLGTRFFAHMRSDGCAAAIETEQHRQLKQIAIEVARELGWNAMAEVAGDTWRADVLATRGNATVAIEVQWSKQDHRETMRRQEAYRAAGVRCLWLFRQRLFPSSRELPAARVEEEDKGFVAVLDTSSGEQRLPVREFLEAAFTRRLRFGFTVGAEAIIRVMCGTLECWRCHRETGIVTFLNLEYGPQQARFTVGDFEEFPDLLASVCSGLTRGAGVGKIKLRYSATQQRTYVSNGCIHCDALVGQFYEHLAWDQQKEVLAVPVRIDERWIQITEERGHGGDGWFVHPVPSSPVT